MEDRNLRVDLKELFRTESRKIAIYLKQTSTKTAGYDPFRNTGTTVHNQNAIYKRAIVRQFTPEKLIIKEFGLALSNSVELIMQSSDVNFIKLAEKIIIQGQEYVPFHSALGNKALIFARPYGMSRVILFSKEDTNAYTS